MKAIRVNAEALSVRASELERIQNELSRLSETIKSVQSNLSWRISGSSAIKGSLSTQNSRLSTQGTKTGTLASGLRNISALYTATEKQLAGGDYSGGLAGSVIGEVAAVAAGIDLFENESTLSYGKWKNKEAFNKSLDVPEQDEISFYSINKDEKWYKQRGTIIEEKFEAKTEASWKSLSGDAKGEYGSASGEIKVATAEAHTSFSAGMYVYEKKEDGSVKRVFSPGIAAEAGASVALLSMAGEGRLGLGENNDMLGVYGKGEVDVGFAEAKAKLSISENEAHAKVSLEADLVKAEGSAGVTVLGTDIGVTGAVKVGLGAHAEVGVTDGKLKVDIGAAVGVGFDIGFEIDMSGTIDAVQNVAESVFNFFSGKW